MAIEVTPTGIAAYAWLYDKDTKFAKKEGRRAARARAGAASRE